MTQKANQRGDTEAESNVGLQVPVRPQKKASKGVTAGGLTVRLSPTGPCVVG